MGQALYRNYRPKKLDEVIGQEHVTTTLKNALKNGKISHAYLLTGPRGVGKTSVARILAHEVNGFKYDENAPSHLDIIEIDAASNRRIDEIRDVRDKVHMTPSSGKYKVYIIDEVHMLTKEAFNALLKTLEEPPAHAIFILATTEAHKLPETIVSRTQRFSFKPIEPTVIVNHLDQIAKKEKLKVSTQALELMAQHGEGSFRDSISLLDQASASGQNIELADVQRLLGIAPNEAIDKLLTAVGGSSARLTIEQLAGLREQGFSAGNIAKQLAKRLRQQVVDNQLPLGRTITLNLLERLISVPASPEPEHLLEIILLEIVLGHLEPKSSTTKEPVASSKDEQPSVIAKEPVKEPSQHLKSEPKASSQPMSSPTQPKATVKAEVFSLEIWPQVLNTIKDRHNTLYSIMRMGQPSFDGQVLTLSFQFAFHHKRLNEARNRQIIDDVISQHATKPIQVVSVVEPPPKKIAVKNESKTNDIQTISNIFGNAEVLDS